MLTPKFEIEQDSNYIYINIRAPYAKITADSEPEIFLDGNEFKFYAQPYYLRLHLPGELIENGQESATYESGHFKIKYAKLNNGENFEGLNLLTKLLTFPKKKISVPTIEVLNEEIVNKCVNVAGINDIKCNGDVNDVNKLNDIKDAGCDSDDSIQDNDDDDWHIDQKLDDSEDMTNYIFANILKPKYGFANMYTDFLNNVQEELNVLDIRSVDSIEMSKRSEIRILKELEDFNEDYYLSEYFQSDHIAYVINFTSNNLTSNDANIEAAFTDDEKDILLKLPRKEYILNKLEERVAMFGLIDILFSYAYDYRTTEGENTVESGWTISKLSATLSWLDYFYNLKEVIISCFRRSLIYPLYRNFLLSQTILKDLINIFKKGQLFILKCLIKIRTILMDSDDRYILNELYIHDYCVWIQSIKHERLQEIAIELDLIQIKKSDLGLDLEVIEAAGQLALNNINNPSIDIDNESLSSNESSDESLSFNESSDESLSSNESSDES